MLSRWTLGAKRMFEGELSTSGLADFATQTSLERCRLPPLERG